MATRKPCYGCGEEPQNRKARQLAGLLFYHVTLLTSIAITTDHAMATSHSSSVAGRSGLSRLFITLSPFRFLIHESLDHVGHRASFQFGQSGQLFFHFRIDSEAEHDLHLLNSSLTVCRHDLCSNLLMVSGDSRVTRAASWTIAHTGALTGQSASLASFSTVTL